MRIRSEWVKGEEKMVWTNDYKIKIIEGEKLAITLIFPEK